MIIRQFFLGASVVSLAGALLVAGCGEDGDSGSPKGDGIAGEGGALGGAAGAAGATAGAAGETSGAGGINSGSGGDGGGPVANPPCAEGTWRARVEDECLPLGECGPWGKVIEPGTDDSEPVCEWSEECPVDEEECPDRRAHLSAGSYHVCAINDGELYCWGMNGQQESLGVDDHFAAEGTGISMSRTPIQPTLIPSSGAVQVDTPGQATCAVYSDGTGACWGTLGKSHGLVPGFDGVSKETSLRRISAGFGASCGIDQMNQVKCWGTHDYLLGVAGVTSSETPIVVQHEGAPLLAREIAGNGSTVCAITVEGALLCWGKDAQLVGSDAPSQVPNAFPAFDGSSARTRVVDVALGKKKACAVLEDGLLKCWDAFDGPRLVTDLPNAVLDVSVEGFATCAVLRDGSVWCWGGNGTPVQVKGLDGQSPETSALHVSMGYGFACALLVTGDYACWGDNRFGMLGDAEARIGPHPSPVEISFSEPVVAVSGSTSRACAQLSTGRVECWHSSMRTPFAVEGVSGEDESSQAATLSGQCATFVDGGAKCWGADHVANIVQGLDGSSPNKTAVSISQIGHSCAARGDGSLICWGSNSMGGLGDGTTTDSETPIEVSGFSGASDAESVVSVETHHGLTCALTKIGSVWCWGTRTGRILGTSSYPNGSLVPVQVPGLEGDSPSTTATRIETWSYDLCAETAASEIRCWGRYWKDGAALGDGTNVADVALGELHVCALYDDGTVTCGGSNRDGQLGYEIDGPYGPVQGLPPIESIYSLGFATCALDEEGRVYCWGDNAKGLLDDGPWYTEPLVNQFP